ncbi:MAG TPA: hypothetical protein VHH92_04580 [Actinomycetota bacterium]|nr:hypothetical protein [Actinomycetota bacterium]
MAGGPLTRILVGTRAGLHAVEKPEDGVPEPIVALGARGEVRWALVGSGDVLRSDDGTWERIASVEGYQGRSLLPTDDDVLVGTSEAHLYRLRRDVLELDDGFEEAPGRDDWYTPWGGPPDTRSMSIDAAGTVYVNVHVGGILRSRGPSGWDPTIDIDADIHQVLAHPDRERLVLAAGAGGLAISEDGGDTWDVTADGLHRPYCRAVAVAGESVLVSASTGPFTKQAAVYRRPLDGSAPFERCAGGLPEWFPSNIDSHCLVAREDLAALGTDGGEVWVTTDAGRTWEPAAQGIPPVTCLLLE